MPLPTTVTDFLASLPAERRKAISRVRSVVRKHLPAGYLRSVGRNSKLLLNVPPTTEGLLHDADVAALTGMHARLRAMFATDLAPATGGGVEVQLTRPSPLSYVRLSERIEQGQAVARYTVSGYDGTNWAELSAGTTIGYAKIDRIDSTRSIERAKVTLEPAAPVRISAYSAS